MAGRGGDAVACGDGGLDDADDDSSCPRIDSPAPKHELFNKMFQEGRSNVNTNHPPSLPVADSRGCCGWRLGT